MSGSLPNMTSHFVSKKDYMDRILVLKTNRSDGKYTMTYVDAKGNTFDFNGQKQLFIMSAVKLRYKELGQTVTYAYKWLEAQDVDFLLLKAVADTIELKKDSADAEEAAYFTSVSEGGLGTEGKTVVDGIIGKMNAYQNAKVKTSGES